MKQAILGNIPTKLMAIFLAVLMWLYLYTSNTDQKELEATFEPVLSMPADMRDNLFIEYYSAGTPLLPDVTSGRVEISGPRSEVQKLKDLQFRPQFGDDLFTEMSGTLAHKVVREDFGLDETFRVQPVFPKDIEIRYQKYVEVEVELLAGLDDVTGTPEEGFEVKDVRTNVKTIKVLVPFSESGKIKQVSIERISVEDSTDSRKELGKLRSSSSLPIKLAKGNEFTVEIIIGPEEHPRELGPLPLHLEGLPGHVAGVTLEPTSIRIRIEGPKALVDSFDEDQIHIFAPIENMNPGERKTVKAADLLRYYLKDPKFKVLKIVFMPKTEEQNRTITVIAPDNSERKR